ncbi:protein of unknown function DUF1206 [Beutenbergia cavernae DSM 12333]|uniref:DUF1206 domain-containing protein n=1 Tax=Beutenbergia cavernae (strain ATCC BAA-8 / DSM 12333 / CCUG 43141 / JCM 11478 / NBRC 16432 / NCIMB 13614 / HKI 0122) TaxID=471853 RepID=C5BXL2_BEUC1|nr:DUF1206 domain-containing protein [Beutenbergia cavernae]ACQ80895.1 protein of unknown function DUF1206 [Beutenbergia cavernae DSM 12333]
MSAADRASDGARRAADHPALTALARVGLVAYGVVLVLVGWIAFRMAWGSAPAEGDQAGAMALIADAPGGTILLWVVGIGLFALALWQLTEAAWGYRDQDGGRRLASRIGAAGKAVAFVVFGILAIRTTGGGGSGGGEAAAGGVLASPGGTAIVTVGGLAVVAIGVYQVVRGVRRDFTDHLDGAMSPTARAVVERVGVAGYVGNGIALAVVGGLLVRAALTEDPEAAGGLDAAFRTIAGQPLGQVLLTVVAVGFVAYGVFQWARARYEDL